jgi:hypothetical protein
VAPNLPNQIHLSSFYQIRHKEQTMSAVIFFTVLAAVVIYFFEVKDFSAPAPQCGEGHPVFSRLGHVFYVKLTRRDYFGHLLPLLMVSVGLPISFAHPALGLTLLALAAVLFIRYGRRSR